MVFLTSIAQMMKSNWQEEHCALLENFMKDCTFFVTSRTSLYSRISVFPQFLDQSFELLQKKLCSRGL